MKTETAATIAGTAAPAFPGETLGKIDSAIDHLGLYRTSDHQYFCNGVGPYFSVTTMLDVLYKPALIPWAKRTVAEFAVTSYINGELGARIGKQGSADTVKWLASLPDYQRNTAATLGTKVHHLADMVARGHQIDSAGFEISEQVKPYLAAFRAFEDRYGRSNIVSSEKAVINFSEGYAGTYDFLLMLKTEEHPEGQLWLVDVKTSSGLYPETGLQLAAYGNAEYIIQPNDPTLYPMPRIQRYGVLHLRPDKGYADGYRFVEYQVTPVDFAAFLAARDLWAWRKEGRFRDNETVEPSPAVPA